MQARHTLKALVFATALLTVIVLSAARADEPEGAHWKASLADAQRAAEESGKPLFLVFRCVP